MASVGASAVVIEPESTGSYPRKAYAIYVLAFLTLVNCLAVLDVQILALLVAPVRQSLRISDTQMGLLLSAGSGGVTAVLSLPLARLADAWSRRGIIAGGLVIWSLCTAGCGLVGTFGQLLVMRIGVSLGEAAFLPAAISLLTDYFPAKQRPTAFSLFQMGLYVAVGTAFTAGGFVAQWASGQAAWTLPLIGTTFPWQMTFLAVGLPGAACALMLWTVRELPRGGPESARAIASLRDVRGFIRANSATLFCHYVGFAFLYLSMGAGVWAPTFFARAHHWTAAQFGQLYGPTVFISGPLGLLCGSWLANVLMSRGYRDALLRLPMLSAAMWIPIGFAYLLIPSAPLSLALMSLGAFVAAMPSGLAPAALMAITPPQMRGQIVALSMAVTPLGLALGPTMVALVTDYVFLDDTRVGMSMLAVTVAAHLASSLLFRAGLRPYVLSQERLAVASQPTRANGAS